MRRLVTRLALVLGLAALMPATALAGTYTLHPNGFGEHSYSAWKGGEGLADSTGNKDQALYFQKKTATTTFAAGVAVFKGFEGIPANELGDLEFWWGDDGHCGAGAPRFNVRVQIAPNVRQTIFVGCQGMTPGAAEPADNGRIFEQRTFDTQFLPGTVVSLSLVFDEGDDVGQGFVYLDDIKAGGHTWTSASDNGNGQTIMQSSTPLAVLLGEPIALALG